jgi:hypothetical protein
VQRWKFSLRTRGRDTEVPTKVEFSRREDAGETAYESVDTRLLTRHRLMPVLATHYLLPTAIRQKVGALVHRREVQARDVFDLSLLFSKAGEDLASYADLAPQAAPAVERAWSLSRSDFQGQVVAFLEPEDGAALSSPEAWDAMQLQVVTSLERIGRLA